MFGGVQRCAQGDFKVQAVVVDAFMAGKLARP